MTIFSKILGGPWPLFPPWLRLCKKRLILMFRSVCRWRVCKRNRKNFDLSKIPENLGKILENPGKNGFWKSRQNPWKSGQKWDPTLFLKKKAPKTHVKTFVGDHTKKGLDLCGRQFVGKTRRNFSCKLGEIRAKILHTPKICLLLHLWFRWTCVFRTQVIPDLHWIIYFAIQIKCVSF